MSRDMLRLLSGGVAAEVRRLDKRRQCRIRKLAITRKPCSCWGYGNRRRHSKGAERSTMQERRANDAGMMG